MILDVKGWYEWSSASASLSEWRIAARCSVRSRAWSSSSRRVTSQRWMLVQRNVLIELLRIWNSTSRLVPQGTIPQYAWGWPLRTSASLTICKSNTLAVATAIAATSIRFLSQRRIVSWFWHQRLPLTNSSILDKAIFDLTDILLVLCCVFLLSWSWWRS